MSKQIESWDECPTGTLQTLGNTLRSEERSRTVSKVARRGMLVTAVVLLLALSMPTLQAVIWPGGISCSECAQGFATYEQHLNHATPMADADADAMLGHLNGCSHCHGAFETKYPGLLAGATTAAASLLGALSLLGAKTRSS